MIDVVAFIPLRGGSKSIPHKNIKIIAGKPLACWVIDAAVNANVIQKVYVATDSQRISDVLDGYYYKSQKVVIIGRSEYTATDTASTESALLEFCQNYDFNHVFLIQATSPLLTGDELNKAWLLYKDKNYDSILSVVRQKRFIWSDEKDKSIPLNYNPLQRPRRQDFNGFMVENGAFYLSKKENILYHNCRISGNIGIFEMDERAYFEIDEPSDWNIIEFFLLKNLLKQKNDLGDIKVLFTDCDGVLTDGGMYYSEKGDELKKFNTRDGIALKKLQGMGIKTGIITGEEVELVKWRAKKLGMDFCFTGVKDKLDFIIKFCNENNIEMSQIAYIGDEINDIDLLSKAGIAACPSDAVSEVKAIPGIIILNNPGGSGVLKEFSEIILNRQNSLS